MAAKKRNFFGEKRVQIFVKNKKFRFLLKMRNFFRFLHRSSAKLKRTAKRPTVLSSLLNMLTILITFMRIYFLTNFRIFCKGVHRLFLRKMSKIKNFQVWVLIDWKLSKELNEV